MLEMGQVLDPSSGLGPGAEDVTPSGGLVQPSGDEGVPQSALEDTWWDQYGDYLIAGGAAVVLLGALYLVLRPKD